jgi:lysophospholipase L1-like esterase
VGPDNSHASTTDTSATLTFTSATTVGQWYIHYLQQPGGGSFTYAVGGGSATTVNTDGALAYQVVNVSGPGALVLAVTVANTAGVLIAGAEARNTTTGQVIMHKLGSGGAQASHFAGMGTGYLETAYQSLAPDVVVICLGTNDHAASVGLSTFRTNIATIVDRVRANVPLADILLLGPGPNNTSAAYPITDYITQLYDLAVELDCGFVDLMSGFGTYTEANARGLFEDAVHPNTAGGLVIGRTIWRAMFTE